MFRRLGRLYATGKISRAQYIRRLKEIERSSQFAIDFLESPLWKVGIIAAIALSSATLLIFK